MRIAVWGGGALGLLWADRLAGRYPDTILIVRTRAQRDELRTQGLRVTGLDGEGRRRKLRIEWAGEEGLPMLDAVFLTVKQGAVSTVTPLLSRVCPPSAPVLLWQNGMGQEKLLLPHLSPRQLYRVITTEGALRTGPAQVRHTGEGESWVGPAFGEDFSPVVERLLRELSSGGIPIHPDPDMERRAWEKLAVNCVINPLTGLWKLPNGALPDRDDFFPWMEGILDEVVGVARGEGVFLSFDELRASVLTVCRKTGANRSSMLQDLDRGKKTEVDFINGAVTEKGREKGIPTPLNERLTFLIHQAEGGGKV